MKNENFLVKVIRTEMPKVHSQTLTCIEYHNSSQRKREEPFKKFTQLLTKTYRTKEWYYTRNKTFSVIKLRVVLKELANHTLLLMSSLKILGGLPMAGRGDISIPKKRLRSKFYLDYQELWFTPGKADLILFWKHISCPITCVDIVQQFHYQEHFSLLH